MKKIKVKATKLPLHVPTLKENGDVVIMLRKTDEPFFVPAENENVKRMLCETDGRLIEVK